VKYLPDGELSVGRKADFFGLRCGVRIPLLAHPFGTVLRASSEGVFMYKKKDLRVPVTCAVLCALSVVFGKLLAINIGDTVRISFENLPIIVSSFMFGPIWGCAVGICADLLGCLIRGFSVNPLITVAAGLMGVIPYISARLVLSDKKSLSVCIAVAVSHIICSVFIKSAALSIWYGTPYFALLITRLPIYAFTGAIEAYVCVILHKRKIIKTGK